MSDTYSDTDSNSDASIAHVDVDDGAEPLISLAVRELCNQLRANDPRVLSTFITSNSLGVCSEPECSEVFQALKENTSVKHLNFRMLFERHNAQRSALSLQNMWNPARLCRHWV
jgi:uncharacterized protein (DUF849 family)